MNDDLDRIAELLRIRFPRCEVTFRRSGKLGPHPSVAVFFPSVENEVFAVGADPERGKAVGMGVGEHVKTESFKPAGYDLFDFEYEGPEHLVGKFKEGARRMYKRWKEFEDEKDAALKPLNMERSSFDPNLAPALAEEVGL